MRLLRIDEFEAQEFANTAWAFAMLGIKSREFFDAMAGTARSRLATFNGRDLANTARAFAKSGIDARELHFEAIADSALKILSEFNA